MKGGGEVQEEATEEVGWCICCSHIAGLNRVMQANERSNACLFLAGVIVTFFCISFFSVFCINLLK